LVFALFAYRWWWWRRWRQQQKQQHSVVSLFPSFVGVTSVDSKHNNKRDFLLLYPLMKIQKIWLDVWWWKQQQQQQQQNHKFALSSLSAS